MISLFSQYPILPAGLVDHSDVVVTRSITVTMLGDENVHVSSVERSRVSLTDHSLCWYACNPKTIARICPASSVPLPTADLLAIPPRPEGWLCDAVTHTVLAHARGAVTLAVFPVSLWCWAIHWCCTRGNYARAR